MSAIQVELGKVAQFINGAAFKPEDWGDEGKKIIRIQNLTDQSKPYNKTLRQVDKKLVVERGDLLVSWSATLGVFEWADEDALLNQHIFRVVPNLHKIDKNYLKHSLKNAITEMDKHLHGATMKHINRGEFLATKIPLPPLAEQQRIAAILDKAAEIKAKREQAIAKSVQLIDARFRSLSNEEKLTEQKVGDLCDLITKGTTPTTLGYSYKDSGILFLRAQNVINGKVTFSKDDLYINKTTHDALGRSKIRAGDVLLTIAGTIGRSAVVEDEKSGMNCNQAVAILRCIKKVNAHYLSAWLSSSLAKDQISKSTVTGVISNLSLSQIANLKIYLPNLNIQNQFALDISKVYEKQDLFKKSYSSICQLIDSLQHQFFAMN